VSNVKSKLGKRFDDLLLVLQPPSRELGSVLQGLLKDSPHVVDLGCGQGNHLRAVGRSESELWIGIDSHQPSLDVALRNKVYDRIICTNIINWLQDSPDASVDTILASCVIEHLDKPLGIILADEMKRVYSRQAIICTPNGFVPQPGTEDNPVNAHRSGWTAKELTDIGFTELTGLYGFKGLRSSFGLPTIKPQILGDLIAKSTSRFVFRHPNLAYQVVGVYRKTP